MRRSRRLVVSFVATVGNYEYGFFWYFYLDGNIQLEVKLTGIVSPMAIEPGTQPEFANVIGDGVAAPHHQHLFNARLDFDVDGAVNEVYEVEAERMPPGPDNPWRNAFRQRSDAARHRGRRAARHRRRRARAAWQIANPDVRNGLGQNRRRTSSCRRCRRRRCSRIPTRRSAGGPASRSTTSGSRRTRPTSGAPRASTRTSTRAATGCRAGPRRTASIAGTDVVVLVHVRCHALRAAGGLAGHAGRVRGLPLDAGRLLRPQPRARRAARPTHCQD